MGKEPGKAAKQSESEKMLDDGVGRLLTSGSYSIVGTKDSIGEKYGG